MHCVRDLKNIVRSVLNQFSSATPPSSLFKHEKGFSVILIVIELNMVIILLFV